MPVMTGFEAIKAIRQLPEHRQLPIIAISASVFEMDEQKSRQAGCDTFLPKPITINSLTQVIGDLLSLEWVVEERQVAQSVLMSELVPPPRHELEILYELTMFGDMEQIQKRVLYLSKMQPQYTLFANRLLGWAQEFEDEQILRLLEQLLGER